MSDITLSVLIPTYNESDLIIKTLDSVFDSLGSTLVNKTEIIILDDGRDELLNKVLEYKGSKNIRVIRNLNTLGKGHSLALGFSEAKGKFVGFLDADLSTHPKYIHRALEVLQSRNIDGFIASRRAKGSLVKRKQSIIKDALGNLLRIFARTFLFHGMKKFEDTQCGFKFFKSNVGKTLYSNLNAPDGVHDLEVLVRANLLGLNIIEEGITWIDERESKRPLNRILVGELISLIKLIFTYQLQQTKTKIQLLKTLGKAHG